MIQVDFDFDKAFKGEVDDAADSADGLATSLDKVKASLAKIKGTAIEKLGSGLSRAQLMAGKMGKGIGGAKKAVSGMGSAARNAARKVKGMSAAAAGAAAGIAGALTGAVMDAGKALAEFALGNQKATRGAANTLKYVTKGKGDFGQFRDAANKMGMSVNELVGDFAEFANMPNVSLNDATDLSMFAADLKSLGLTQELDAVKEAIAGGKAPADAMRDSLAKLKTMGFDAAGDGSTAAAIAAKSADGALAKLKATVGDSLTKAFSQAGGPISAFTDILGKLAASPQFIQGLELIGSVVAGVAGAVVLALAAIVAGFGYLVDFAEGAGQAMADIAVMFPTAWEDAKAWVLGSVNDIIGSMASMASAVGSAITSAVTWVASLPGKFTAAIASVVGAVNGLGAQLLSGGASAAKNLISGLVSGIASGVGAVADAAKNLASSAIASAKEALGINSPSKVFQGIGGSVSEGFEGGVEPVDVADNLMPGGPQAAAKAMEAPSGGASSGGGGGNVITINVSGASDPATTAAAIRDELDRYFAGAAMAMGAA